ncbi:peptidoglycan recognition protein-like [Hetaerina americana]|uniref:peptidoglycan recognition protein-like n=1 Tax=Hetaerina americana TaxID=62018 RepID=UPI003A7F5FFD
MTSTCTTREDCVRILRSHQPANTKDKSPISGFSFIVGGNGVVYRGRGWDSEGAHTFEYNDRSIGIALIGRFESQPPTREQLSATKKLIDCGIKKRKLRRDYRLIGHVQVSSTNCPGNLLYKIIKDWPNWFSFSEYDDDVEEDY